MIRRVLVLAAGVGLAVSLATPASAGEEPYCISGDTSCEGYECPSPFVPKVNTGFSDTGPWIVICGLP